MLSVTLCIRSMYKTYEKEAGEGWHLFTVERILFIIILRRLKNISVIIILTTYYYIISYNSTSGLND